MVNIAKMSKIQRNRHESKWCGWSPSAAARRICKGDFLANPAQFVQGKRNIRLAKKRVAKKLHRKRQKILNRGKLILKNT